MIMEDIDAKSDRVSVPDLPQDIRTDDPCEILQCTLTSVSHILFHTQAV